MRIAIMGTGQMGRRLGIGWSRVGHRIVFGSRRPEDKTDLRAELPGATVTSHTEALAETELIVIALPYTAVEPFARQHAAQLRDKVVLDISNPFSHLPDNRISGAEITAAAIGPGARVVAGFKDNFWQTLLEPVDLNGLVRDVHFAGNDEADKQIVKQLIEDLGFRPVDCGPLKNARVLDVMVSLMLELDRRYGGGDRKSSWKFLS
jgi:predicted dinucleotide-binding enzyme